MNEFDLKASGWDLNPMHMERSKAVAKQITERIPLNTSMTALEYGAGTGITSFLLQDHLKQITMMDNSAEMVRIMMEKISSSEAKNLEAVSFDLEKNDWTAKKFDLILTQMVLHHVADIEGIIRKFNDVLNPGGYLAIADLYPEDGSFHGTGFSGHNGFEIEALSNVIKKNGFRNISVRKCFVFDKKISETESRQYDVFLLIASRSAV